jgi:hypothetical protein
MFIMEGLNRLPGVGFAVEFRLLQLLNQTGQPFLFLL